MITTERFFTGVIFAVLLGWCALAQQAHNRTVPKHARRPLQIEMHVPFEPTAFPSGPHFYVMYELHLKNLGAVPLTLSRIEVLDADAENSQPIAAFDAEQLEALVQPLGEALSDRKERLVLRDGRSA